ncbi:neuronal acetylcholine receptor subunit alpha-10-like [Diadema antillarum]|uniref:neuronal acetylcholine receptor subunit alpha-10-like n=1 Tax=Diadema antillarum TaxID=105358 RepID=UPI003A883AF3
MAGTNVGADRVFQTAQLSSYLLDNGYSSVVRPVMHQSETITVKMDIAVIGLLDMDEANQIMTANTYMTQRWRDSFLVWDPAAFWNITAIQIPIESIWRPDVILINNANDNLDGGIRWTHATVDFTGEVVWRTNAILMSACPMNPLYFPFDTQECPLVFGSWTFNGDQVDVIINSTVGDMSQFVGNGEWDLDGFPVQREVTHKLCCAGDYPVITYTIVLQRRFLFYFFNLVIPCVLISSLVLMGFYLPSDAGEKITLTLTLLLALTVFLLLVAETMPPTSDLVPLISQYFAAIIVAVGVCTVFAVINLNLHHRGDSKRAPKCLRRVVLGKLAKFVGVRTIPVDEEDDEVDSVTPAAASSSFMDACKSQDDVGVGVLNPVFEGDEGNEDPFACTASSSSSTCDGNEIERFMTRAMRAVTYLTKLTVDEAESSQLSKEWMHIAMVLDHCCVYTFLFIFFLITIGTILVAAVRAS